MYFITYFSSHSDDFFTNGYKFIFSPLPISSVVMDPILEYFTERYSISIFKLDAETYAIFAPSSEAGNVMANYALESIKKYKKKAIKLSMMRCASQVNYLVYKRFMIRRHQIVTVTLTAN